MYWSGVKLEEKIVVKEFKGRSILAGKTEGEAIVSQFGFNAYASFFNNLHDQVETSYCADSNNQDTYGKVLTNKILCLPQTTGSTSAGAVWQRIASLGIGPKAILFSNSIDSLAAGGLIVADRWAGKRIITVDKLGEEFLYSVKDGDRVVISEDGSVTIIKN